MMAGTGPGWRFWFVEDGVETWVFWEDETPKLEINQKRELDFFVFGMRVFIKYGPGRLAVVLL